MSDLQNAPIGVQYDWEVEHGNPERAAQMRREVINAGNGDQLGIPKGFCREIFSNALPSHDSNACERCQAELARIARFEQALTQAGGMHYQRRDIRLNHRGQP